MDSSLEEPGFTKRDEMTTEEEEGILFPLFAVSVTGDGPPRRTWRRRHVRTVKLNL